MRKLLHLYYSPFLKLDVEAMWGRLATCGRLSIGPLLSIRPAIGMRMLLCIAALATGCGYHVGGKADLIPKNIKTIAVPAFANGTERYKLARLLATNITQEFITRTKYNIVADPNQADAVLKGTLSSFARLLRSFPIPVSGRATGAEIVVTLQITLTERATGKVLFTQPSQEFRERYEISTDPQTYFDESGTAIERVARDVARTVVTAILENFLTVTAAQMIARVKKGGLPPAALLLGPEAYDRRRLKDALTAAFPEGSVTQHDLSEIYAGRSPRRCAIALAIRLRTPASGSSTRKPCCREARRPATTTKAMDPPAIRRRSAAYLKDPTPGVALIFEASRFDFEGDDKRKQDRVRKFYGAIPDVIELRRYASHEARRETEALAARAGFRLDDAALDLLVEALGADIARIAVEIEKLSLYAGNRTVTVDDIGALVPDARATTIFALVNAVGRRDRVRALEILDTLTRDGEYLPLALAFLSTQFRMALVAREAGLKSGSQVQSHFTKMGIADVGFARRSGLSDGCEIQQGATRARHEIDLSKRIADCATHGPTTASSWSSLSCGWPANSHRIFVGQPILAAAAFQAAPSARSLNPLVYLRRQCLHAQSQLRLIPRSRILLDDPALRRTVDDRKGLRQHRGGRLGVLAGKGAADLANRVTKTRLVLPVEFRAAFGLSHPLECGNCIGHLC